MGLIVVGTFLLAAILLLATSRFFEDPKAFLLSPVIVFAVAWGASALIYGSGQDFIRDDTAYSLLGFYLAFVIPGAWMMYARSWETIGRPPVVIEPHVARRLVVILLTMQALAAVSAVTYLLSAMNYADMPFDSVPPMSALRGVLATQKYEVPLPFRLLSQFRYGNYFAPIAMMVLFRDGHIRKWAVIASITLACLYPLCFLERSGLMRVLILALFAYLFVFEIRVAKLLRLGALLAVLVTAFVVLVPILRGQGDEGGGNLYNYVAGAWSGFDNFVSGSGSGQVVVLENQDIFVRPGGYDFVHSDSPALVSIMTEAYRLCNAVNICQQKLANFGEYVYDPIYTNIYTAARSFYQDLGFLGMIPAVAFVSMIFHFLYLSTMRNASVAATYTAAYIAFTCVMSVLSDTFLLRDMVFPLIIIYALAKICGGWQLWFGNRRASHGRLAITNPTSDAGPGPMGNNS
ncbi:MULTISPECIES: O-antigen polymerase [unclassified Cupriavidus]|uniref:O-antigen polymerase n=1 Tax=Cupriavidus sp. H19C3 TaxID=3241603 RepID=UPI003BF83AC1